MRNPRSTGSTANSSQPKSRSTSTRAMSKSSATSTPTRSKRPVSLDFEVDPELLNPSYNQLRRPRLPYGIVVNDNPAGILIPSDQLETAGWLTMPSDDELETIALGENDVSGLFLTEARILILAHVPEYIRYKDAEQLASKGEDETLALTVIGDYETYRAQLDKQVMDVCSEHAMVFLDEDNQPLHTLPIVVRFKNVSLWSLRSTMEDYYRLTERAFADYTQQPFSGKSDRWRSLVVLAVTFQATKEGKGKNKSHCCKTVSNTTPSSETLPDIFLGTPKLKQVVWNLQDEILGFVESSPALPAGDGEALKALPSAAKALPATPQRGRRAQAEDLAVGDEEDDFTDTMDDDDFIDVEATDEDDLEFDDDEDFDEEDDE